LRLGVGGTLMALSNLLTQLLEHDMSPIEQSRARNDSLVAAGSSASSCQACAISRNVL